MGGPFFLPAVTDFVTICGLTVGMRMTATEMAATSCYTTLADYYKYDRIWPVYFRRCHASCFQEEHFQSFDSKYWALIFPKKCGCTAIITHLWMSKSWPTVLRTWKVTFSLTIGGKSAEQNCNSSGFGAHTMYQNPHGNFAVLWKNFAILRGDLEF